MFRNSYEFIDKKQKDDYIEGIPGEYNVMFTYTIVDYFIERKIPRVIRFRPGNTYNIIITDYSVDTHLIFSGSEIKLNGTKLAPRVKNLRIDTNKPVYVDLSEGPYGVPTNINCPAVTIANYKDTKDRDSAEAFYKLARYINSGKLTIANCTLSSNDIPFTLGKENVTIQDSTIIANNTFELYGRQINILNTVIVSNKKITVYGSSFTPSFLDSSYLISESENVELTGNFELSQTKIVQKDRKEKGHQKQIKPD